MKKHYRRQINFFFINISVLRNSYYFVCVCGQKIILCSSAHNSHNHLQVDLTNPSTQIVTITWHEICVRMNSANVLAARLYIFLLSKFEWTKEKKKLKFEVVTLMPKFWSTTYLHTIYTYLLGPANFFFADILYICA